MKPGLNRWFVTFLAVLAFLAPVKFGLPVILQSAMTPPDGLMEWLVSSWPGQLVVMLCFGALVWTVLDSKRVPVRMNALFVLPVIWLATQVVAVPGSINCQVSVDTVLLFAACVLVFYATACYVRTPATAGKIFGALVLATLVTCGAALEQHFGGLEETRRLAAEMQSRMAMTPDYLLKLTSNRVFGTFIYPNTLAGFLVLALAPVLAWIWLRRWEARVKWAVMAVACAVMIYCLLLTGSRGGFLALAVTIVAGTCCFVRKKRLLVVGLTVAVLAGVFWLSLRNGLTHLGAGSVESRMDYWQGAVTIARDFPWLGTGPGTFGSIYPKHKTAASEEAKLVHNNFLEMWCDSGIAALGVYAALWALALWQAYRMVRQRDGDPVSVAIFAALTGWVVHGLVDFDLYVPGVAIPTFMLLGMVQGLEESPTPAKSSRVNPVLVFVCAVTALGVVWVDGRMLMANIAFGRATRADVQRATALVPWNAHYRSVAGQLAFAEGLRDEGLEHFRAAVRWDPFHAAHHRRLAEALKVIGGYDAEAEAEYRRARELNPTSVEKTR